MLAQIATIHSNLCDVEKQFGVVFNRNTAVMDQDNNYDLLHLLVDATVVPTIAPNERIISTLALITPDDEVAICPIVAVQNVTGTAFTGVKVIDSTGTQLQSGTIFPNPEKPLPEAMGLFAGPSVNSFSSTTTQLPNGDFTVRMTGTIDADYILFSVDIMSFDITLTFHGDN